MDKKKRAKEKKRFRFAQKYNIYIFNKGANIVNRKPPKCYKKGTDFN